MAFFFAISQIMAYFAPELLGFIQKKRRIYESNTDGQ